MTDQGADHTALDELAAGYVLYALEPEDEWRFRQHAGQCPRCRKLVTGFRQVTEALAQTAPAAQPSGQLGDRIIAAAMADDGRWRRLASPGPDARPATAGGAVLSHPAEPVVCPVVPLRRRAPRPWWRVAAATAVAALIAGGLWAGLATSPGAGQPSRLAACARPPACTQVVLTAAGTQRAAATVVVHGRTVWMEPAAMAANPAGDIYVLWQITGAHTPLPVGAFDIRPGPHAPLRIGGLVAPYTATWAFAVSLEHGRAIPARPAKPVALGQVS